MNDFHTAVMWQLSLRQLTIAGCHSNSLDVSCRCHSFQFAFVEDFLSSVFQFFNSSPLSNHSYESSSQASGYNQPPSGGHSGGGYGSSGGQAGGYGGSGSHQQPSQHGGGHYNQPPSYNSPPPQSYSQQSQYGQGGGKAISACSDGATSHDYLSFFFRSLSQCV